MRLCPNLVVFHLQRCVVEQLALHPIVPAQSRRATNHPPAEKMDCPRHAAVPEDIGVSFAIAIDGMAHGRHGRIQSSVGRVDLHPFDRIEIGNGIPKGRGGRADLEGLALCLCRCGFHRPENFNLARPQIDLATDEGQFAAGRFYEHCRTRSG